VNLTEPSVNGVHGDLSTLLPADPRTPRIRPERKNGKTRKAQDAPYVAVTDVDLSGVPADLVAVLDEEPGPDRSRQSASFVGLALRAGIPAERIVALAAARHRPTIAKYGSRAEAEIWRMVDKWGGVLVLEEEPCPNIPNTGDAGNRDVGTRPFPLAGKLCPFAVSIHTARDHPDVPLGVEGCTYDKRCGKWYCYVCADTMRLEHCRRARQVATVTWAGRPVSEKLIGACEWEALHKDLGRSGIRQYLRMPQPDGTLLIWVPAEMDGFIPVGDQKPALIKAFQRMDRKGFSGSRGLLPPLTPRKKTTPRKTSKRRVYATKQPFAEARERLEAVPGMTVEATVTRRVRHFFVWTWLPPLDPYECCRAYHQLEDILHDHMRVHVT
jgi:hypothetical protein